MERLRELHLFAGAGGGILAGHLLGHRCIGAVECEPYAQKVLLARQRDGSLPAFPIFSDVRDFDGRPYAGRVDIVAGGFPCQDISGAGQGAGIDGEQSGLWVEMARIVHEVEPRFVYVENSPMLTSRGLGRVLGDLAALGFDARWGVLGAHHTGAPHERERIWILANHPSERRGARRPRGSTAGRARQHEQAFSDVPRPDKDRVERRQQLPSGFGKARGGASSPWPTEPELGRVADGVANRVERIAAIGNGQVPRVAARAWRILTETTP
jgi:DNA (cytosine-5)-methyltransferase 1